MSKALIVLGQSIPVNGTVETMARESQLLAKDFERYSFSVRPLAVRKISGSEHFIDSGLIQSDLTVNHNGKLSFYPMKVETIFNSDRPYGWNNGSMIQSRGLNTRISSGIHFSSAPFDINIQPEWVYASNSNYANTIHYGVPGNGIYSKVFAGQSFLNINLGKFRMGYSNQNLWWGPGQFSSLLMSNNAPGFGHFHFSSRQPIHTAAFDLEWQIIGGGLSQDSTLSSENYSHKKGPYTNQWRYLNAMVLSINPNFLKGLHLGFTRSLQVYQTWFQNKDISMFEKYMPMLSQFFKKKIYTQANAPLFDDGKDQLASVFMRFVMPRSHFEFYFEYGYNDFKTNVRDLALDAQHSSAYIVGFKKVIPKNNHRYFSISGEITQMAQPPDFVVRNAGNWYVHNTVKQGMTHMNQLLGSGSGLGNNVQTIQFESINGVNRLGIKLQRIQNDPKKQTLDVNNIWIVPLQWTDITFGPVFNRHWKKVTLSGELQMVHSTNYGWSYQNKFNIFSALNFSYKW